MPILLHYPISANSPYEVASNGNDHRMTGCRRRTVFIIAPLTDVYYPKTLCHLQKILSTLIRQNIYVTTHDFIFSNRPGYRISRHASFWLCWLLFCYLTYWLPNFSRVFEPFYSTWNLEELLQRIEKRGGWYDSVVFQFFDRYYKDFLSSFLFTNIIIYVALPGYFSPKKIKIQTTLLTILLILPVLIYTYFSVYTGFADAVRKGQRQIIPDNLYLLAIWAKGITFNLPTVAGLAVAIKLIKRWWLKLQETEQLAREKARAELQLLKAQIHPHFLFNTLNNIYFFTLSASLQAPEMIRKLSDMLRYILNECDSGAVPLEKEINMIQDYMALEKIRYGEQMEMIIDIKGNCHNKMVSPLLLIPFIENSFKHGASKMLAHPSVKLNISIAENNLSFLLANNKPAPATDPVKPEAISRNGSIGLANVKKRLQLLYPGTHELSILNEAESFVVALKIKLLEIEPVTDEPERMQIERHEMA